MFKVDRRTSTVFPVGGGVFDHKTERACRLNTLQRERERRRVRTSDVHPCSDENEEFVVHYLLSLDHDDDLMASRRGVEMLHA